MNCMLLQFFICVNTLFVFSGGFLRLFLHCIPALNISALLRTLDTSWGICYGTVRVDGCGQPGSVLP